MEMKDSNIPCSDGDIESYRQLMDELLQRLFSICRSITGEGIRKTMNIIAEHVPLSIMETPSGTQVFDWQIPDEWNISDAFIKDEAGQRIIDFQKSNLHVVNYSIPIHKVMTLNALRPYLHTLPDQPQAIPYMTTYYEKKWGFCLTHEQYKTLRSDVNYEVCINSSLTPGVLTIAEAILPGETDREILFSTYCCHPSLANNELSGPIIVTALYKYLRSLPKRRYTYRFYYGPETIGALVFLDKRGDHLKQKMDAGFVVTCCGDAGPFTYKKVRRPDTLLDKSILHVLKFSRVAHKILEFFPTGSDDRQYCAPGFDLPVGTLMRSMYGTYPEYHTSLDNLEFVSSDSLLETLRVYINCIHVLEHNRYYRNLKPFGEPMLGKYGLYHSLGGQKNQGNFTKQLRYILNYSDTHHDLLDIANLLEQPMWECETAVARLLEAHLLELWENSENPKTNQ